MYFLLIVKLPDMSVPQQLITQSRLTSDVEATIKSALETLEII